MKVLQILACHRLGGTETFTIDLVGKLRELGIDAYLANLWVPSELDTIASQKLKQYYFGIPSLGYWLGPRCLWKTFLLLRRQKFDIVHAYGLRVSLAVRLMRLLAPIGRLCIGIRGPEEQRNAIESFFDRITEGLVDKVVCNSHSVANMRMWREETNVNKIEVIPNAIDIHRFDPAGYRHISRKSVGITHNGFLLACVGNFRPEKDHRNLIEAVDKIHTRIKDVKILLVGQDPMQEEIQRLVTGKKLEEFFCFTGPRQDIPELLSVCDGFVLPSRNEGMPRALMEAMAMGLPVIATDAGGILEVIENNISGLIVPKQNPDALAQGLLKIISDSQLRNRLGKAARKRIVEHFSFEVIIKRYVELYNSLLAG